MKRFLSVCLLMLCLSFPVFAGHNVPGGYACNCGAVGCVADYPGECDGHNSNQQSQPPSGGTVELSIVIAALLLWLRLRS